MTTRRPETCPPIQTWRTAPLTRKLCGILIGTLTLVAVWLVIAPPTDAVNPTRADFLVPAVLCLVVAAIIHRCAFQTRLTATAWGLIVTNPVLRRHVAWSEITGVEAGKNGIWILREDRWAVTAWAVQKAPISQIRRRVTRADVVVQQLTEMARAHGAPLAENPRGGYRPGA